MTLSMGVDILEFLIGLNDFEEPELIEEIKIAKAPSLQRVILNSFDSRESYERILPGIFLNDIEHFNKEQKELFGGGDDKEEVFPKSMYKLFDDFYSKAVRFVKNGIKLIQNLKGSKEEQKIIQEMKDILQISSSFPVKNSSFLMTKIIFYSEFGINKEIVFETSISVIQLLYSNGQFKSSHELLNTFLVRYLETEELNRIKKILFLSAIKKGGEISPNVFESIVLDYEKTLNESEQLDHSIFALTSPSRDVFNNEKLEFFMDVISSKIVSGNPEENEKIKTQLGPHTEVMMSCLKKYVSKVDFQIDSNEFFRIVSETFTQAVHNEIDMINKAKAISNNKSFIADCEKKLMDMLKNSVSDAPVLDSKKQDVRDINEDRVPSSNEYEVGRLGKKISGLEKVIRRLKHRIVSQDEELESQHKMIISQRKTMSELKSQCNRTQNDVESLRDDMDEIRRSLKKKKQTAAPTSHQEDKRMQKRNKKSRDPSPSSSSGGRSRRNNNNRDPSPPPQRGRKRRELSPQRRSRRDPSPLRRKRDSSPPRRNNRDLSPPRSRKRNSSPPRSRKREPSPPRSRKKRDSSPSPQRRNRRDPSPQKRRNEPPRRNEDRRNEDRRNEDRRNEPRRIEERRNEQPPRRIEERRTVSVIRNTPTSTRRRRDSEEDRRKRRMENQRRELENEMKGGGGGGGSRKKKKNERSSSSRGGGGFKKAVKIPDEFMDAMNPNESYSVYKRNNPMIDTSSSGGKDEPFKYRSSGGGSGGVQQQKRISPVANRQPRSGGYDDENSGGRYHRRNQQQQQQQQQSNRPIERYSSRVGGGGRRNSSSSSPRVDLKILPNQVLIKFIGKRPFTFSVVSMNDRLTQYRMSKIVFNMQEGIATAELSEAFRDLVFDSLDGMEMFGVEIGLFPIIQDKIIPDTHIVVLEGAPVNTTEKSIKDIYKNNGTIADLRKINKEGTKFEISFISTKGVENTVKQTGSKFRGERITMVAKSDITAGSAGMVRRNVEMKKNIPTSTGRNPYSDMKGRDPPPRKKKIKQQQEETEEGGRYAPRNQKIDDSSNSSSSSQDINYYRQLKEQNEFILFKTVFVKNLGPSSNDMVVRNHFRECGYVEFVEFRDSQSASVLFNKYNSAPKAIHRMNGKMFQNKQISVDVDLRSEFVLGSEIRIHIVEEGKIKNIDVFSQYELTSFFTDKFGKSISKEMFRFCGKETFLKTKTIDQFFDVVESLDMTPLKDDNSKKKKKKANPRSIADLYACPLRNDLVDHRGLKVKCIGLPNNFDRLKLKRIFKRSFPLVDLRIGRQDHQMVGFVVFSNVLDAKKWIQVGFVKVGGRNRIRLAQFTQRDDRAFEEAKGM